MKAYLVYRLKDGELPVYEIAGPALVIGEEGENLVLVTKPKRVILPLFEVTCQTENPRHAYLHFKQVIEERVTALEEYLDGPEADAAVKERRPSLLVVAVRTEPVYVLADPQKPSWWMTCGIGCFTPLCGVETIRGLRKRLGVGKASALELPARCPRLDSTARLRVVQQLREQLFGRKKLPGLPTSLRGPEPPPGRWPMSPR